MLDDDFSRFLKESRSRKVYLKPYWGNSGDELIWLGCEYLLDQCGVERVMNPSNADTILWPGGNPTVWNVTLEEWQGSWVRWPEHEFVFGPATFRKGVGDWSNLLRDAPVRIGGVFSRDTEGYSSLRNLGLADTVRTGLGNDPAVQLKGSKWLTRQQEGCRSDYVLACFRNDQEGMVRSSRVSRWASCPLVWRYYQRIERRKSVERRERLLSTVAKNSGSQLGVRMTDASLYNFQLFLETIRHAAEVHTDRLHCMVFAALLGKPVVAYPAKHRKLEGVYRYSLMSWADIQFAERF